MDPISQVRISGSRSPAFPSSPVSTFEQQRTSPASDVATWNRSFSRARSLSPPSSYRYVLSSAELANSDSFDDWRRGAALTLPLSVGGGARWDAFPVPQTIRNLGNYLLDVRLPEWVFEINTRSTPTRIAPLPGARIVDMFVEEDATFQSSFERIAEESLELARIHNQQMQGDLNWRMPVDAIIRKAFIKYRAQPNVWTPAECDFICDLPCSMPYSSGPVDVERTIIADTLISTTLFPTPSMFDLDSQIFEELRVDRERHDSPVVCVPHLAVKHNKNPSGFGSGSGQSSINGVANEVTLLLCAVAHQRRLLGFEREPIFGLACSNGKVRAFASYWKDNQIQIVRLYAEDFDLQVTEQACLFFLLLLRIRHYSIAFASQLEGVNGSAIEERLKSSERSWKADPTYPPTPGTSWLPPSPSRWPALSPAPLSPTLRPPSPARSSTSTDNSFAPEIDMELDDRSGISTDENVVGFKIPGST